VEWRIPLKNKFAEKQLKQSPAVKLYKTIQAGTLVKSSIEMLSFHVGYSFNTLGLHVICFLQPRVSRYFFNALFGPGATLNKKLAFHPLHLQ
jgi:hypothetical protein